MVIDYKFAVVTPERGKGGVDAADAPKFARWLEEAGVDMLHVAQANHTGNMADTIPPMGVQPYGFFADIAGQVKEAVSIPVSTVGRIIDPAMAERIVESEKADIVGLGRPLLCDAAFRATRDVRITSRTVHSWPACSMRKTVTREPVLSRLLQRKEMLRL